MIFTSSFARLGKCRNNVCTRWQRFLYPSPLAQWPQNDFESLPEPTLSFCFSFSILPSCYVSPSSKMGANIKYAASRRSRGIRLAVGLILLIALVRFFGITHRLQYDAASYNWVFDTSALPTIRHGPSGKSPAYTQHTTNWKGYSLKPLAYVFPQYHAIPENDKFWGTNFTEWDNVRRVEVNKHGIETLRPSEEIGYYNLLDYDVRKRYSKLVRDSG